MLDITKFILIPTLHTLRMRNMPILGDRPDAKKLPKNPLYKDFLDDRLANDIIHNFPNLQVLNLEKSYH